MPKKSRVLLGLASVAVAGALVAAGLSVVSATGAAADPPTPTVAPADATTTTPIKHLVVIYGENESFDHYFGTYPYATNSDGTPFSAAAGTPGLAGSSQTVNNELSAGLVPNTTLPSVNPNSTNAAPNPNEYQPFRLNSSEALTCDQNHSYGPEEQAADGGLNDKAVEFTSNDTCGSSGAFKSPGLTMGYYDGNTVTALWNYAQNYSLNDNSYSDTFGPSTPGALNLISGQTHGIHAVDPFTGATVSSSSLVSSPDSDHVGTISGDGDPAFDDCSGNDHTATNSVGILTGKNVGDLLNEQNLSWGWFEGGFRPTTAYEGSGTDAKCDATHNDVDGFSSVDYVPHHEPFQFYASTSNPHHLPPSSVQAVGETDQANHQYDLSDFNNALASGVLPSVSFLKASQYEDAHPGNSDPLDEQDFLVREINAVEESPDWSSSAIVIAYDDSDGWYDHQSSAVLNGSDDTAGGDQPMCTTAAADTAVGAAGGYQDRCGPGTHQPLLVISPYAKANYVDHTETEQASITKFIEDNWQTGTIGDNSFDTRDGTLDNMFDFTATTGKQVILNEDGSVKSSDEICLAPSGCAEPAFTGAQPTDAVVDQPFYFKAATSGTPAPTLALTGGSLPAGLSFSPRTGVISGTPTTVGTSPITVTASSSAGTTTASFTLVVGNGYATSGGTGVANPTQNGVPGGGSTGSGGGGSGTSSPPVDVSTAAQLDSAVTQANSAHQHVEIDLQGDLSMDANLSITGDVALDATSPASLDTSNYYITVASAATLTIGSNLTVHQPSTAVISGNVHPIRLASDDTLNIFGSVLTDLSNTSDYTIDAVGTGIVVNVTGGTVTTVEGRAMYASDGSAIWNLENATVTATQPTTGYATYRGNFVLRGTTTTTGLSGGGAGIIDFRGYTVAASPDPSAFVGGDDITLTGSTGSGTGVVQTAVITYTTDGSDPATSATAQTYSTPFPVAIGTTVKAAYVEGGLRGLEATVVYDTDHDQVPGDIASVAALADVTVGEGTPVAQIQLPTTVSVTLADSRVKVENVTWDTSALDTSSVGTTQLSGAIQLQNGITNSQSVVAHVNVVVAETDIGSFVFAPTGSIIAGEPSAAAGTTVATMTSTGGDGAHYSYSLTDTDADNASFAIDGATLKAATNLTEGVYNVQIAATSGPHSVTAYFAIQASANPSGLSPIGVYSATTTDPFTVANTVQTQTDGHGTASASAATAVFGTDVGLTEAPSTGYHFDHWTVTDPAVGLSVGQDSHVTMPATGLTSVAHFAPNQYTVDFAGNGSTSGSVGAQTLTYDAPSALHANAFTRTGHAFVGWATTPGGAVAYKDGATVQNLASTAGAKVTLYAVWAANAYTVAFNANGGGGKMASQAFTIGTAAALRVSAFTRSGYTFAGWAKTRTGQVVYKNKATVENLTSTGGATVTLYAAWAANRYTVSFNANGGHGKMTSQAFTYGQAAALRVSAFSRPGYTFAGWAKSRTGQVVYKNRASLKNLTAKANATVTLYAVWTANRYTVAFNANGGHGKMTAQAFTYGKAATLRVSAFSRSGYTFAGWAKSRTGKVVYKNRASVKNLTAKAKAKVTLYAVWKRKRA